MNAPVERKVAAAGSAGIVVGVIVWCLTTWVPAFHAGLPDPLLALINWLIPVIAGGVSAYFAKHTPRTDPAAQEVMRESAPGRHEAG